MTFIVPEQSLPLNPTMDITSPPELHRNNNLPPMHVLSGT
jgi:hypothetical protein